MSPSVLPREPHGYSVEWLPRPNGPCQTKGCDHKSVAWTRWFYSYRRGDIWVEVHAKRWACAEHVAEFAKKHNLQVMRECA